MKRMRRDSRETQADGSVLCCALWMGGPTYSALENAPTPWGRRVVLIGDPLTWTALDAETRVKGVRVTGYVGSSDDALSLAFTPHVRFRAYAWRMNLP